MLWAFSQYIIKQVRGGVLCNKKTNKLNYNGGDY